MSKHKKQYDDDDGRTIAHMNVDGMPWYAHGSVKSDRAGQDGCAGREQLDARQSRAFVWGVLKATLLVTLVFVVGYFLFILFCTNIWFA
jgi:hypothetical protein